MSVCCGSCTEGSRQLILCLVRAVRHYAVFCLACCLAAITSFARADCVELAQPQVQLPNGRWVCAVHKTPIIEAVAFVESRDPVLHHFHGAMARVHACNPNSLYPEAALRPTKQFRLPTRLDYCRTCERRMVSAARRADAHFKEHGTYPP